MTAYSIFFAVGILVMPSMCFSQNPAYSHSNQLEFKKVQVITYNGQIIRSANLIIHPFSNSISFVSTMPGKTLNLNLKDVSSIDVQKGNHALISGLAGLGLGLSVFYFIYESNNWNDPFSDVSSETISRTLFISAGLGLGIGVAIGTGVKKYRKIFINGSFIIN